MIAEESSEVSKGGPPRPTERDLLAERRARRSALSGDMALVHRAEVAEATVQTLETHLSSLQQRLQEAEAERREGIERLATSENELRRVKQQEYAEQQLRVEAERALAAATDRRLSDLRSMGRSTDAVAGLEIVQKLQARVAEIEISAVRLAEEVETERRARERTERALEAMRESHATMAATVGELRDIASKLRDAAVNPAGGMAGAPAWVSSAGTESPSREPSSQVQREEMADALAAAVERLRARAQESLPSPLLPGDAPTESQAPQLSRKPHRHSMSLIGRLLLARKHRRERRRAADGSPNIAKHR